MDGYVPPFSVTNRMLALAARIAEKAGRLSPVGAFEAKPHLRRSNRIRSIYASLAIEANSLSPDEVRDVIDGKAVVGPQREIQEVRNACAAYEMPGSFDPYSLSDLKKLHGVMTRLTVAESGVFRSCNEGVFNNGRCIFMAPPPQFVPELMRALFDWMRASREEVHPLILSSVFHYEFVFIHPFADGNGRVARLWQTALLSQWDPVFRYLPLESCIQAFQEDYYAAIARCHSVGVSDAFIGFMLDMIDRTLDQALEQLGEADACLSPALRRLLGVMEYGAVYTGAQLMERLSLRSRASFRKLYLHPALEAGLIAMTIPDRPTSRNQAYMRTQVRRI